MNFLDVEAGSHISETSHTTKFALLALALSLCANVQHVECRDNPTQSGKLLGYCITFYSYIACSLRRITELSLEMLNNHLVKSIVVLTTWLFALCPFLVFAQHLNMRYRRFYKISNTSLVGKVTETQQVKGYFDCSFLCLERGPFVCLSFNLGKADDNGYYTCELSSSERYLEPQRIQQPSSYDYYGTTTEVLSVVHTYHFINSTHIN